MQLAIIMFYKFLHLHLQDSIIVYLAFFLNFFGRFLSHRVCLPWRGWGPSIDRHLLTWECSIVVDLHIFVVQIAFLMYIFVISGYLSELR
jgi:hypothetical protein